MNYFKVRLKPNSLGADIMRDSNYTLRWNRSAREAYGYDVSFKEEKNPDRWVGWVAIFAAGVICGGFIV
jgi:hypothetical protein